jgi:hypothetical protein
MRAEKEKEKEEEKNNNKNKCNSHLQSGTLFGLLMPWSQERSVSTARYCLYSDEEVVDPSRAGAAGQSTGGLSPS